MSASCSHPMGTPTPITMADGVAQRLAITGYALRHSPDERMGMGVRLMWLRTFDRNGGQIPPADWRTRIRVAD